MISAIEHHKRVVEVKEQDEVHVLLLCNFSYYLYGESLIRSYGKVFEKLKDTGYKLLASNVNDYDTAACKSYLQSDCWVLKESKTLNISEAHAFFWTCDIKTVGIFRSDARYDSVYVETWIRKPSANF